MAPSLLSTKEYRMDRDYRADFLAYLEKHWPNGDYVRSVLAAGFVEDLRASDPDLLAGWLNLNAPQFVTQFIGDRDRSRRSRLTADAPRKRFADVAEQLTAGDAEAMSLFTATLVVNDDELSRPIGLMTKADHLYVAKKHVEGSNALLFEAAFHRAVAKKIPNGKTTADVLTQDAYLRLRDSIRSPKTTAA